MSKTADTLGAGRLAPGPVPCAPVSLKRLRISLGTFVAVEARAGNPASAAAALESAFGAIAEVDRLMHPQRATSDLARISQAPVNTPVSVHPSVHELLQLARRLHALTDGVFDPCLPGRPGRLQDIETGSDEVTCRAPVALDFGGFAKGYAVDRAIDALKRAGCTAGLVNAGGDLRVFGPKAIPVLLRGPQGRLTEVELVDAALAVSDADSRCGPAEHRGYYARRPGGWAEGRAVGSDSTDALVTRYAAVMACEASVADALTKCVLLCPRERSDEALHAFAARRLGTQ